MSIKTKYFTLTTLVLVLSFSGCSSSTAVSTVQKSNTTTSSVAGTMWAGQDSHQNDYEYHFKRNGTLHYRSSMGGKLYTNGTWKQTQNRIYMETNGKYSERKGVISNHTMYGSAWNVKGKRWTWSAVKQ